MSRNYHTPIENLSRWLLRAAEATNLPLNQEVDEDSEIADTHVALCELRTYNPEGHALGQLLLDAARWLRDPVPELARVYEEVHGAPPPATEAAEVREGLLLGLPVRQPNQERIWGVWTVAPWPEMPASWRGVAAVFAPDPWTALVTTARQASAWRPA